MPLEKTSTVEPLLGMLGLRPMSGYEIRQVMASSTANFWSESFGQIYPALKKMVAAGLVTEEDHGGEGHPSKKVYAITEAGRARLKEWLGMPARPQVPRSELLLKVFFGDHAERGAVRSHVKATRALYESDLQRFEPMLVNMETTYKAHPGMPYWRMTLRYGMAEAHMIITWCNETLHELDKLGKRRA